MQTLNVGAGRTDAEYKAAEEQRRADLRSDVQTYAMYFFVAAGLAALGTGLFPILVPGLIRMGEFDLLSWLRGIFAIGSFDMLAIYGRDLLQNNVLYFAAAAAAWVVVLALLGLAARKGQRWAFWIGVVLYAADIVPVILMLSIWSLLTVGLHGFFVMQWFKGQRALAELKEPSGAAAAAAAR